MVLSEEIEQLKLQEQQQSLKAQENHDNNNYQESTTTINDNLQVPQCLKLHPNIEKLKLEECVKTQQGNNHEENRRQEEHTKSRTDLENSETAQIIEEIIEGISLQGRRGTLVRTISAVLR